MADTKGSALTAHTTPAVTDPIYVFPSSTSLQATMDMYLGLMVRQADGRLTLATATPITTTGQSSKSVVYYTPYNGNKIALYNGTIWKLYQFTEKSVTLSGLTSARNYDVFGYVNSGALKIDIGPTWNAGAVSGSDTARGTGAGSTELTTQDGAWVNANAITTGIAGDSVAAKAGRYLGSFRTTGTTTTEDSLTKRFLFNAQNIVQRPLRRIEGTTSWLKGALATGTWRQANGSTSNQIEVLAGLLGPSMMAMRVSALCANATSGQSENVGIGEDSITAVSSEATSCFHYHPAANSYTNGFAFLSKAVPLGYHYYAWLEQYSGGTPTWFGTSSPSDMGITGELSA